MATASKTSTANGRYMPGVCNINSVEIARRRRAGYLGVALFIIVATPLLWLTVPRYARLVLFAPAFLAAVGFLQAHYKFCVGYAAAGVQNATEGDKVAQEIVKKAARDLDKKRARTINTQAAAIALAVAVLAVLVP